MEEIISVAASALAAGAAIALKGVATDAINETYQALKDFIFKDRDQKKITSLGPAPKPEELRTVFEEEIKNTEESLDQSLFENKLASLIDALQANSTALNSEVVGVEIAGFISSLNVDHINLNTGNVSNVGKTGVKISETGRVEDLSVGKINL